MRYRHSLSRAKARRLRERFINSTKLSFGLNHARALGLFPYFALFITHGSALSFVVFVNGFVFHVLYPKNKTVKRFDICCNVIIGGFVNVRTRSLPVLGLSSLGFICFVANSVCVYRKDSIVFKTLVHIVCVQWTCFCALFAAHKTV
jgi:hypothetical protein